MSEIESSQLLTWRALWVETAERLRGEANEARWICEEVSGTRGVDWLVELDRPAGERAVARLDAMVARRLAGEPLQYVLGSWAFRRLELLVDPRVLIPRPETELVAEVALDLSRELMARRGAPITVVDLGTGSGAIGLSLAAELPLDGVSIWLTDASAEALDVARANLAGIGRHAVNVGIGEGSWFGALPGKLRGRLDLVVSNPPYIAPGDADLEASVLDWEPAGALFADESGLRDLRAIVEGAVDWLAPAGWLVLEIGARQGPAVERLLRFASFESIEIRRDLAGLDRIAVGRRS